MHRRSSFTRPLLVGLILASLASLPSRPSPRPTAGAQERTEAPAPSIPKNEAMIDVGGRRLHARVYGDGSPAVVLVSGLEIPQSNWDSVIPRLSRSTTVVTYDRAGTGRSEIGGLPTHGRRSAEDLHVLLDKLDVPPPYILVGHSYGGNVVRLFASAYPGDTGGLILEETQHEDNLVEMRKVLEGKDLETFEQVVVAGFRAPEDPRTEADYRNVTRDQVRESGPLPRVPFAVLTVAGRAKAMADLFSPAGVEKLEALDRNLNARQAALIPGGRLVMVEGTGHLVHVDKPEALIGPVVEMIARARGKAIRQGWAPDHSR